ncbi:MAG: hypothetical protein JKX74_07285 [Flavobacteriales bacterium]|nr:hypothetical protein [Flavobacteriales bacterium]
MSKILLGTIVFLTLIILILVIAVMLLYIFRRRYTRERFAFFALGGTITMATAIFVPMLFSHNLITLCAAAGSTFFDLTIAVPQPGYSEQILAAIVFISFVNLISKIHKNWDGAISTREHDMRRLSENSSMWENGYLQAKDFWLQKKAIVQYIDEQDTSKLNIFSKVDEEKKSWHEDVSELLLLISKQYKVDINKDWYSEYNCFISEYGKNNALIGIFCVHDEPDDVVLQNVMRFVRSQNKTPYKLVIAIKNGKGHRREEENEDLKLEFRYEGELLNSIVDFSDYRNYIKSQFLSTEVTLGTKITLSDIYIELSSKTDRGELINKTEHYIETWLDNSTDNKHLAILGEYGQGKSVLSLKLTHSLLEILSDDSRIPILIELRGKSPRNLNRLEILSNWASNYGVNPKAVLKLHQAGRLLLIFEGFDEMDVVGDQEIRLNHFESLWKFANPKSKIIITGRPNFFLDDKELKIALGIHDPVDTMPYCEAIYLNSFSIEQIEMAMRNIRKNTREQIIEILQGEDKSSFYDLISRPSILHLVGVIWEERKLSQYKDKISSALIISEFIQYSYSRQTQKGVRFVLTEQEREFFMIGVAAGMLRNTEYTNQIHKDDLQKIILKLYSDFPEEVSKSKSALIHSESKSLKVRMQGNPFAEDSILTDVRSCGILVKDLTRTDYFKFAHKSFLEYLISFFYTESLIRDKGYFNVVVNSINRALTIPISSVTNTKETTAFIAQILLNKLELSQNDDKKENCKKLFGILFPNETLGKMPRLAIFLSLLASPRVWMYLWMPFVFLSTILVFEERFLFLGLSSDESFSTPFISTLMKVMVGFMAIMPVYYLMIRRRISGTTSNYSLLGISQFYGFKRLTIWLECCYELNIQDDLIKEVIPNYGLQAIKNNDPLYFLVLIVRVIKNLIVRIIKK